MPDPNQLTPEGGDNQQSSTELDYATAYNQLRPEYTRTTQRLSEYEQFFEALSDPATQKEALEALGYTVDSGSDESQQAQQQQTSTSTDEWEDPLEKELEALRAEVTTLRQRGELEDESKAQQEIIELRDEYIGDALDYIESETKSKFTPREEEVLGNLAIAMAGSDGVPDVPGAYQAIYGDDGVLTARQQQAQEQRKARPAFAAPGGSSRGDGGLEKPKTRAERTHYIDERIRAMSQD
jgi:hypothetical protein